MKIFLTGATGFIGGHMARTLSENGYTVTCLVRNTSRSEVKQLSLLPGIAIVKGEWGNPTSWLEHVAGHDVVINTVGIIRESKKASFTTIHTNTPIALFAQAKAVGVRKIIQVSALGVREYATTKYNRSKYIADQYLIQSDIPYVILRPSIVYGPYDHSMKLFAQLARLPLSPIPGNGQLRMQPLHVNDLVQTMLIAIQKDDICNVTVNVGGGDILTFTEILTLLAQHQQKKKLYKLYIPWALMWLAAKMTDTIKRGPINSEELRMLKMENFTDNGPFIQIFRFTPRSFREGVRQR